MSSDCTSSVPFQMTVLLPLSLIRHFHLVGPLLQKNDGLNAMDDELERFRVNLTHLEITDIHLLDMALPRCGEKASQFENNKNRTQNVENTPLIGRCIMVFEILVLKQRVHFSTNTVPVTSPGGERF